jgi:hypothetical protein
VATTADFINVTYIIKIGSNTTTTLLGYNVIAFAVAAGLVRVAVADYAMAGAVTGLAIFRLAPVFAGAGNSITVLAVAWVAAGAVAAGRIDVTYIAICSISTTLLGSCVIACPITACLVRVAVTNLTSAAPTQVWHRFVLQKPTAQQVVPVEQQ